MRFVAALAAVVLSAAALSAQPPSPVRLPTGWTIQPAGAQMPLDTLPMSTAVSPDGNFLLVLNAGTKTPSISVFSVSPLKELGRVPVADAWLGLAFSPNGRSVYAGGAARGSVFDFPSPQGELKQVREIPATAEHTVRDFIGDVAISPDGRTLYAADLYRDTIDAISLASGRVTERYKTARRPYRILFHPDGKAFFVSSWADGTVVLHDATNGSELGRIRLGPHTTDMVLSNRKIPEDDQSTWRYRLFVTASNSNSVFVVGVGDNKTLNLLETVNVGMTPMHPLGMTPSALALSADQLELLVVCSDANAAAVADISESRSVVAGFIPTGWYPTAARILKDGRTVVLNGRGAGKGAGTMSVVDALTEESLDKYTQSAMSLLPLRPEGPPAAQSAIQNVIYIVKGGRSYDEVFGKLGKGNGDPTKAVFDEATAPNHFKLAREFATLDNFYVSAEYAGEGRNFIAAAIAPDYTEKLWPSSAAGRRNLYDYEGGEPANLPPAGYLWTNAMSAGLTVRNYGLFVRNRPQAGPDGVEVGGFGDPALQAITNTHYRGADADYPDTTRAQAFLADLAQFEKSGTMPRLTIINLPGDSFPANATGKLTPRAAFADHDAALGMIVESVSKSRFWPKTAIFVVEEDSQNGPDHVDSHRSVMLAISPYIKRGIVDSTIYSQSSVLRTMELILGMRPMTHYDAAAQPLTAAFGSAPNPAPYVAAKPGVSTTERNR